MRREPLNVTSLRNDLRPPWRHLEVVAETGSTNADLLARAAAGEDIDGVVLIAEHQTAGHGRMGRTWSAAPRAAITLSAGVGTANVPVAGWGWLPLATGVAVVDAIAAVTGVEAGLKWPNDVLAGPAAPGSGGKLAGILAEQAGDAIVVGIGLNVSADRDELPAGQATSLWLEGAADTRRADILVAILRELEQWYLRWANGAQPGNAEACGLRAAYLRSCSTVGRDVRVELPGGGTLTGRACDVDDVGRLLVSGAGGVHAVSAGDVVHVRPQT